MPCHCCERYAARIVSVLYFVVYVRRSISSDLCHCSTPNPLFTFFSCFLLPFELFIWQPIDTSELKWGCLSATQKSARVHIVMMTPRLQLSGLLESTLWMLGCNLLLISWNQFIVVNWGWNTSVAGLVLTFIMWYASFVWGPTTQYRFGRIFSASSHRNYSSS